MDEDTLKTIQEISRILRKRIYSIPDASGSDPGSGFHAPSQHTANRKAGHLTSIIGVMAAIRSFVMTGITGDLIKSISVMERLIPVPV